MASPTTSRSSRAGASRTATTPQRASATSGSAAIAGPGVGGTALAPSVSASPHYTTSLRSRHSLYGTEDRVVLDFGSSVVKAGFSGETGPRECRRTNGSRAGAAGARTRALPLLTTEEEGLWGYEKGEPSEEEWQAREHRLKRVVRSIWFENLLTDPRSRKVIVLENPLFSTRVKEMIARILFDNLQVPSLSFASAPVLALMAAGQGTGLVVDVGHLETTVMPVYHSRPLFPYLTTTPVAGHRLNRRLRALLLAFASHAPPPPSLSSTELVQIGRVPRDMLNTDLVEEIKTRLCFVGEEVPPPSAGAASTLEAGSGLSSPPADLDESDPDEALVRYLYECYAPTAPSTRPVSLRVPTPTPTMGSSAAAGHPVGRGWVQVPGWVRERAAEVLWEEGDETDSDERGIVGVVLECLLRLPIDLRKPMASSILVTGGTAMLPGFFPRFKAALLAQLSKSHPPSPPPSPPLPSSGGEGETEARSDAMSVDAADPARSESSEEADQPAASSNPPTEDIAKKRRRHALSTRLHYVRHSPRYASLVPLAPHLAILNHPCPAPTIGGVEASSHVRKREGSAPSFSPALQSWVGGSLAGALKTGGQEVTREMWDAGPATATATARRLVTSPGGQRSAEAVGDEEEDVEMRYERGDREGRLPDWTRLA